MLRLAIAFALAAIVGSAAFAQPTALISSNENYTNSDVPPAAGLPPARYNPPRYNRGGNEQYGWSTYEISPSGQYLAFLGFIDAPVIPRPEVIVLFDLTANTATHIARTDQVPSFANEAYVGFDDVLGVNDSGVVAFSGDLDAATDVRDFVATFDVTTGNTTLVARRGGDASGVSGLPNDATWGIFDSAQITADGRVGFRTNFFDGTGITSDNDQLFVLGNTILAQDDVTTPGNQTGTPQTVSNLFSIGLRVGADGTPKWQATLNGPTDTNVVITLDGDVVVQEGTTLPGFSSPIDTPFPRLSLSGNDEVMFAGDNDDGQDWVFDGTTVLAATGDAVEAGSSELFDDGLEEDTFFGWHRRGSNVAIGGFTTAGRAVVTLNGNVVLAEGDAIDEDGDGNVETDRIIDRFRPGDVRVDAMGRVYALVGLRDDNGVVFTGEEGIGQALVVIQPGAMNPTPTPTPTSAAATATPGGSTATPVPTELAPTVPAGGTTTPVATDFAPPTSTPGDGDGSGGTSGCAACGSGLGGVLLLGLGLMLATRGRLRRGR